MKASYTLPRTLLACVLITAVAPVLASGGGPVSMPQMDMQRSQSPQDRARDSYNDGVRAVRKADKYAEQALEGNNQGKQDRAARDAQEAYAKALGKFQQAVQNDPQMHEAWNYVGYTNRKLRNYDAALAAYDRALALRPGYPEALEYRGEAYLALNRVSDAEQSYLDLFAGNRVLADKLLAAMKGWLDAQRTAGAADANTISELDKWIQERAQIAGQTASLTREGTASSWR